MTVRTTALGAILLDLDGTLLDNPMDRFVPAYLDALSRTVASHVAPDRLVPALLAATRAMDGNDGSGPTNEETFASHFFPALGIERSELTPVFDRFYAEVFPDLRRLTAPAPGARELVEWALAHDLQVAIATNPLFPRTAIEQRLAWAGVGVEEFDYDLVTTYENMHATKDHPAYYREILAALARTPGECLMAGDDWGWDIAPTVDLGVPAFWVADPEAPPPEEDVPLVGQGSLVDLLGWLESGTD